MGNHYVWLTTPQPTSASPRPARVTRFCPPDGPSFRSWANPLADTIRPGSQPRRPRRPTPARRTPRLWTRSDRCYKRSLTASSTTTSPRSATPSTPATTCCTPYALPPRWASCVSATACAPGSGHWLTEERVLADVYADVLAGLAGGRRHSIRRWLRAHRSDACPVISHPRQQQRARQRPSPFSRLEGHAELAESGER